METIFVTGGTGFVANHVILALLAAGYAVRTTVRDPSREAGLRALLARNGAEPGDRLTVFAADLSSDAGWAEAVAGCTYVQHVASPFPMGIPKDENDLIAPARDGTLRVLRAARDAGVARVVMTSSFAAIGYGHKPRAEPYTEADWTDVDGGDVQPYIKSKTLAERAAWDFIAAEGSALELAVVNPVAVFGPALGRPISTSLKIVLGMLAGGIPVLPDVRFGVVDVRDVAELQVKAMTDPAARGERFLAVAEPEISMADIADILRRQLGPVAARAPRWRIPSPLLRLIALFDENARQAVPHLGRRRPASGTKARQMLGWQPRSNEEAIVATAESLIALGMVKPAR
jgi:nucleoside-diphosphate-sugar epimerase